MITILTLISLAHADPRSEPARCEAIWTGPSAVCDLSGSWAATGLGANEAAARAAAVARLRKALGAGAEATAGRVGRGATNMVSTCIDDAATRARVECYTESELREERLCYLDLPEPDCWTGDTMTTEGTVWRSMERGRDQICREMEDELKDSPMSAEQVAACRARCYQNARVRCPQGQLDAYQRYADRPAFLEDLTGG